MSYKAYRYTVTLPIPTTCHPTFCHSFLSNGLVLSCFSHHHRISKTKQQLGAQKVQKLSLQQQTRKSLHVVKPSLRMDQANQSRPSPSPQIPQPAHQLDADDEDENVKQLGDCSTLYLSLQDCLVKTNRNWKSCQLEVQALKACNERKNRGK